MKIQFKHFDDTCCLNGLKRKFCLNCSRITPYDNGICNICDENKKYYL
jgi:hypothetical protein